MGTDFDALAAPHRRELLAHCYRMLGTPDEAEDAVQETYLRAWRGYDRFDGRSSLRTWLYRIATNVCLTAIEPRGRRPLPSGLGGPAAPDDPLVERDLRWLGPLPDDPAAVAAGRAGLRLALVAALQHLPGRQRAVLILRDVLGWPAAEVADLLGTSTVAVKSALQRARDRLGALALVEDEVSEGHGELLDRYVAAFAAADMATLTALLRADATLEMPPFATWFRGRSDVLAFLAARVFGAMTMIPTSANGQPAAAVYDADGRPHGIQVLDVRDGLITRMVAFLDPALFPRFGLPDSFPAPAGSAPAWTPQPS
jgi:RNA polymerase sigma-70 factor (ECF subfamily)